MSHLCDNTVAGLTGQRDNALASTCEYPPFPLPLFEMCAKFWRLKVLNSRFALHGIAPPQFTVCPGLPLAKDADSKDRDGTTVLGKTSNSRRMRELGSVEDLTRKITVP